MAQLVVQAGADEGRTFSLKDERVRIGRNSNNDIVLHDRSVSRGHAQIVRRDGAFFVSDEGSTQGTLVNGERCAGERQLQNNDLIRLGSAELVFQLKSAGAPEPPSEDTRPPSFKKTFPTAIRRTPLPDEALEDHTIAFSVPIEPGASGEGLSLQRLGLLTKVADAIRSVYELEELLGVLMDALFKLFKPDRGVVLLSEGPDEELVPRVARPENEEIKISQTIVRQAVRQRRSLLVTDTAADERFSDALSVKSLSIQAAICCPLVCKEKVLGALYLDTRLNLFAYQEEDLVLLNLIAANAAMAIENALLIQEKLQSQRLSADNVGALVGESAAMAKVRERIQELAPSSAPLLITGKPGAGKYYAAKVLHRAAGNGDRPFVTVDCADYAHDEASKMLFGQTPGDATPLPGGKAPAASGGGVGAGGVGAGGVGAGGALHLAHGGTLVLRHAGALDPVSQKLLSQHLEAQAGDKERHPQTRVLATTRSSLNERVEAGDFLPRLAEQLSANTLEIPPMMRRKEDILPLARLFLSEYGRQTRTFEQHLSGSAEDALSVLRFKEDNAAELREVVEFAALMTDGSAIGSEHVFTGPKAKDGRMEYDLAQIAPVQFLVRRNVSRLLQALTAAVFIGITVLCFTSGESLKLARAVANGLVWGLWWPGLLLVFLLAGRLWCMVCPISAAGRVTRLIWSLKLPPPQWMKKYTGWIVGVLFLAIVWAEYVFHMPERPFATGIFLVTLACSSIVLCVLFQREVWCRYLCPLGGLSATYAVSSVIQIHANHKVCSTQCKTHECFKGSPEEPACPMFHHPLFVRDAHFCKLCFTCLRTCPNQSARVYIRPLLQDIWRLGDLSATLLPFAPVVFLLSLLLLVAGEIHWEPRILGPFTALSALMLALGFGLGALLPRLLSRDGDPTIGARVTFALLLLAWGPFMAFHLTHIPELESVRLQINSESDLAGMIPEFFLGTKLTLLLFLQYASILVSAFLAALTFWRIRAHAEKQGVELHPWGWRVLVATGACYVLAAMVTVFLGKFYL